MSGGNSPNDSAFFQIVDWSNIVAAVITGFVTLSLFVVRSKKDSDDQKKEKQSQEHRKIISEQVEFRQDLLHETQSLRKENRDLWEDLEKCRTRYKDLYHDYLRDCASDQGKTNLS